ncbi:MAG: ACP S-malonyltransferase [Planctomycetota bacterium]|nr:MAG: ACP S-malonyltransferase [Planctomycetota bacterium]
MNESLVILCPGQGAQAVGMGKAWSEASPEAARVFGQADEILGDRLGAPISSLCFEGPAERLNQTDVSQPAIYVTSLASLAGLRAEWGAGNGELPLAACAGLSLGEYTALTVAGAIDFEHGLELVALRGRAMQDAAEASASGMVALIGADEAAATELCEKAAQGEVLVPANFNAPGQVVVSGAAGACDRAEQIASEMGLRATRLPVAGAFHSPLMQPAADRLKAALAQTPIREPRCQVMSNVTGESHQAEHDGTIVESIRRRLVEQLTSPVRWADNCRWLSGRNPGAAYHELAPGKTLAGLMRRIDRNIKVETHDEPA